MKRAAAFALLVMLVPVLAHACPVCFGSPDDPMVKGASKGIWVLLGFIGFVQLGLIAMFWSFWRRSRAQKRFRDSFRVIGGGSS
jgi:heme/copper-type cytochrome/quinol oxidase subunit 2